MTVLTLVPLRTAADFADWFRPGAEYVLRVADGMGLETDGLPAVVDEAEAAMRDDRAGTDVSEPVARVVSSALLADAAFGPPFLEWTPLWYELALAGPTHYADWRLRRVAARYAETLDSVSVPRYSRPRDALVEGRPATAFVSGFTDRFAFASALLHVEWFAPVAREWGMSLPSGLVERTRRETVELYAGRRSMTDLSPDVRRFQRLLFTDETWVRDVDDRYGLDSTLFSVWERVLRRERERFAAE